MKLRIAKALHEDARTCAEEIGVDLTTWVRRAIRWYNAVGLIDATEDRVAIPAKYECATRAASVPITLNGVDEFPPFVKTAMARGVMHCSDRRVPLSPEAIEEARKLNELNRRLARRRAAAALDTATNAG